MLEYKKDTYETVAIKNDYEDEYNDLMIKKDFNFLPYFEIRLLT